MQQSRNESIYQLHANYEPAGDQPKAIAQVNEWIAAGVNNMTIHGITGSGKTFTMANIIASNNRPALIYSPNKILAYQLYEELKAFFPNNEVHYYVSTFDFYIPEFVKYGEFHTKQSVSNEILESMSLDTAQALATNKRDVIVVASSSCLFGTGSPDVFRQSMIYLDLADPEHIENVVKVLARAGYKEASADGYNRGSYALMHNFIDVYTDLVAKTLRVIRLSFDPEGYLNGIRYYERDMGSKDNPISMAPRSMTNVTIFPATRFTQELFSAEEYELIKENMLHEAKQQQNHLNPDFYEALVERINDDIDQIAATGYCNGIENYAWYMNRQNLHRRFQRDDYYTQQPYTIMSFFPQDTLVFIDESHLSLGQIKGAAFADFTRKKSLISHGIRLPSCVINRPLTKDEFQGKNFQTIHISATPAKEELELSQEHVTNLFIRPTYLLDPDVEYVYVDQLEKQGIDYTKHVINQIMESKARGGAVLLRCPDGKVAYNYTQILRDYGIKAECMLADTPAPERRILVRRLQGEDVAVVDNIKVERQKQDGSYDEDNPPMKVLPALDVIVGVNLIREGLDIPRVEKVIIVYADRGGFLNDHTSLIQVMGRAARNQHGKVLIYLANETMITPQIKRAVDETLERRALQMAYNREHGKTPKTTTSNSILTSLRAVVDEGYNEEFEGLFNDADNNSKLNQYNDATLAAELAQSLAQLEQELSSDVVAPATKVNVEQTATKQTTSQQHAQASSTPSTTSEANSFADDAELTLADLDILLQAHGSSTASNDSKQAVKFGSIIDASGSNASANSSDAFEMALSQAALNNQSTVGYNKFAGNKKQASSPVQAKPKARPSNLTSAAEEELLANLLSDLTQPGLSTPVATSATTTMDVQNDVPNQNQAAVTRDSQCEGASQEQVQAQDQALAQSNTTKTKAKTKTKAATTDKDTSDSDLLPDFDSIFEATAKVNKASKPRKKTNPLDTASENIDPDLASLLDDLLKE